jgi:protein SCO1
MRALAAIVFLMAAGGAAVAERPEFAPRIGAQLDLGRKLVDASGATGSLADFLAGRPAFLVLGYHECPNLCGVTQYSVAAALRRTDLDPAAYRALFVSIDAGEGVADARAAKVALGEQVGGEALAPWRFLVGPDGAGAELAAAAGLQFQPRDRIDQFAHPIALIALTPGGRIARVLPALSFRPRDLEFALIEASEGRLGSLAKRVYLLCAGFDETKGQYTPIIRTAVQAGGIVTVLVLGGAILLLARRRRE